jgi:hypothetical protein
MLPRRAANVQYFIAGISLMDADKTLGVPQLEIDDGIPRLPLHFMEKDAFHEHPLFAGQGLELISPFHATFSDKIGTPLIKGG